MKRRSAIIMAILALGATWFLGVDWSWFVYDCPDCGYGKDVVSYRFCTIPIQQSTHEVPTVLQKVAADLGVPCSHSRTECWHKHRWRGLVVCHGPCINGLHRMVGDDAWYDDRASVKVAALAERDPSVPQDFVHHVFEKHEFRFARTVLERAGVLKNPQQ